MVHLKQASTTDACGISLLRFPFHQQGSTPFLGSFVSPKTQLLFSQTGSGKEPQQGTKTALHSTHFPGNQQYFSMLYSLSTDKEVRESTAAQFWDQSIQLQPWQFKSYFSSMSRAGMTHVGTLVRYILATSIQLHEGAKKHAGWQVRSSPNQLIHKKLSRMLHKHWPEASILSWEGQYCLLMGSSITPYC